FFYKPINCGPKVGKMIARTKNYANRRSRCQMPARLEPPGFPGLLDHLVGEVRAVADQPGRLAL
ncbi:MAG TPA: hypothetical protein VNM70_04840, partial [Burkholderiales bacterium]|nr:hypothetical protein [Burkholderiales bacterium]